MWYYTTRRCAEGADLFAGVAQLVEQLICNQQVAGSSPITSSKSSKLRLTTTYYGSGFSFVCFYRHFAQNCKQ